MAEENKEILAGDKAMKRVKGNGVLLGQKPKLGSIVLKPSNGRFGAKESIARVPFDYGCKLGATDTNNRRQGVVFQPVAVSSNLAKEKYTIVRIVERKTMASNTGKENDHFIFGSTTGSVSVGSSGTPIVGSVPGRPPDELVGKQVEASVNLKSTMK